MELQKLQKMTRLFTDAVGDKAPIQQVTVFLFVAQAESTNEEIEVADVGKHCNLSSASTSRNLAAIGDWHRLQRPGAKLVTLEVSLADRRRKFVKLTKQGKKLVEKLQAL